jgi:RNA polymerase sigma factor (sigma-70 family)
LGVDRTNKRDGGEEALEALVERAKKGDRAAQESMVHEIRDRVYGLALRMLWHPEDAEDATQEILVKVVTRLSSFRGESAFTTWVYRVASNHLLSTRKRRAERTEITFERFEEQLEEGLADTSRPPATDVGQELLVEEVKVGCMQGMLLCLDRDQRLAYVLGEILGLTGEEGAYALGVTPATFRKRLSRARERVRRFMSSNCGLLDPENSCRCSRQVGPAVSNGRIDPNRLLFAGYPVRSRRDAGLAERVREMDELERAAALFRSHPDYAAPGALGERLKELVGPSGSPSFAND